MLTRHALPLLLSFCFVACSGAGNTTYTNTKHKYSVQTSTVWGVKAEEGKPAEADRVQLFRVVDAPGKKAIYDPKTLLTGEAPFNCSVLLLTIAAEPNPEKLEPLENLKRNTNRFDPADFETTTFAGRPAVRDKSKGAKVYYLNVGSTLFMVSGFEMKGRDTDMGRPLPSNPEAVKILEETMSTVKFEEP